MASLRVVSLGVVEAFHGRIRTIANLAVREESASSTCALLTAPFCSEDVCATMARGVPGDCARRKWAQEPAAPARQKTRRENCAALEGSAHSTNALRLKHATCTRVRSTTSSSHAVFWFAMDRSRRASSVSSELCFATFPY